MPKLASKTITSARLASSRIQTGKTYVKIADGVVPGMTWMVSKSGKVRSYVFFGGHRHDVGKAD